MCVDDCFSLRRRDRCPADGREIDKMCYGVFMGCDVLGLEEVQPLLRSWDSGLINRLLGDVWEINCAVYSVKICSWDDFFLLYCIVRVYTDSL